MSGNVTIVKKKSDSDITNFSSFSPDADDATIAHLSIASKPRVKLTAKEAYEQGVITEAGVKEGFLVVLPVKLKPRKGKERYFFATDAEFTGRRLWMTIYIAGNEDLDEDGMYNYIPLFMNPKARLHIIVK
jgi:hypothetical protein